MSTADDKLEARIVAVITKFLEDNHYLRRNLAYDDVEKLKVIMRESIMSMIQAHALECQMNRQQKHTLITQRIRDYLQIITTVATILAAVGGWIYVQQITISAHIANVTRSNTTNTSQSYTHR